MEHVAPPFFKQGPSARARLFFFSILALTLLVADTRFDALTAVRNVLGTALYPVERGVLAPTQWISGVAAHFQSLARLESDNERLTREKAQLAESALRTASLAAENAHLRRLVGARAAISARSVAAEILYDARDPFSRKIIVDRGTNDGVARGQPVIDEDGVVGQATRVFAFSSEVTLLTDHEQAIPVKLVRTGMRAVAYGASGGLLDLRFVPTSADVRKGDLLVTSGLDGVYPDGLPVARVESVEKSAALGFAKILCTPSGGTDRNRHVLILLIPAAAAPPPEEPAATKPRGKRSKSTATP